MFYVEENTESSTSKSKSKIGESMTKFSLKESGYEYLRHSELLSSKSANDSNMAADYCLPKQQYIISQLSSAEADGKKIVQDMVLQLNGILFAQTYRAYCTKY